MKLREFLLSDKGISLLLHGLKSAVALYINWVVLSQFTKFDYVTWSVTSSLIMVATASDLGIGQYAVTRFINTDARRWPAIMKDCLVALAPLAFVAILFVFIFISGPSLLYKITMASFLGLRALSIPFGALLNAVNQFKVRKAIELVAYLASSVVISAIAYAEMGVIWALLTINTAFLLGGVATVFATSRYLTIGAVFVGKPTGSAVLEVYRASMPFMVNNLTGLLTYGGFIWISSFFLGVNDLAKIAVLHTFILMNLYQLYEVFLKARQADLIEPRIAARAKRINLLVMVSVPLIFFGLGGEVFKVLSDTLAFSRLDILLFSLFISIELGFLLTQSLAQIRWDLSKNLVQYSLVRLLCQAVALVTFTLLPASVGLTEYIALLAATSSVGFLLVFRHLNSKLQHDLLSKA